MSTKTDDTEVWDGLTEAERAQIAEDEKEDRASEEEDDDGDEDDGEGGMEAGDVEEESEKDGGTKTVEEAIDLKVQPVPLLKGEAPEDARAKLDELDQKFDELAAKFDDGDLTAKEYQAEMRKLQAEQDTLKTAVLKAELSAEITAQEQERQWAADCQAFLSAHADVSKSMLRLKAFDEVLRGVTADEDNAKLSNAEQLGKAYDLWLKELGLEAPKPEKPAGKAKAEPEQPQRRAVKTVPTLGGLPAAVGNDPSDGRFAYLDRMSETDPIAYEKALAKLSPAEQEEYLRAA